jgi:hypothetical protein
MSTTSASISAAALTASKATAAGSAPSRSERIVGTPTRSPQVCSWSAAAARKVSAAPSTTSRSSATSTRASLPTVVVLPVPLTPTTSTTAGRIPRPATRRPAVHRRVDQGEQVLAQPAPHDRLVGGALDRPWCAASRRARSSASTPRSAASRVSSTSSQAASSSLPAGQQREQPLPRAVLLTGPGGPAAAQAPPQNRRDQKMRDPVARARPTCPSPGADAERLVELVEVAGHGVGPQVHRGVRVDLRGAARPRRLASPSPRHTCAQPRKKRWSRGPPVDLRRARAHRRGRCGRPPGARWSGRTEVADVLADGQGAVDLVARGVVGSPARRTGR